MNRRPLTVGEEIRSLRWIRRLAQELVDHETIRIHGVVCKSGRKVLKELDHALAIQGMKERRKRA